MLYGAGYKTLGDAVKRAGQIATDPFGVNKKGKTVVDASGNMSVTYGTKGSNLGAIGQKYANDLNAANSSNDKGYLPIAPTKTNTSSDAPVLPTVSAQGSGSEDNRKAKIAENIGKSWDDTGDSIKSTGKELDSEGKFISNLGKVRDKYLESNDKYKQKTDEAIAGNKTLIEKNQQGELDDLAGDLRKNVKNTQIMLGVKGASGGSASRAAASALGSAAGKDRASILTTRGNEMSEQNQAAADALEQYNLRRKQAYDWEEEARKQAITDYEADRKALDRLKKNSDKWKQEDLDAESNSRLQDLLTSLATISARAKTFRDTLAAKMTEFGGSADELENASVSVNAPSELNTPDFNENIDLTTSDPNAEDFYDPNNTGKRVIKGYDAFGNPIYADELATATA